MRASNTGTAMIVHQLKLSKSPPSHGFHLLVKTVTMSVGGAPRGRPASQH